MSKKQNLINQIREEIISIDGELAEIRRANNLQPVIGEGSLDAKIFFVGEAPGKNESITGKPFCGSAGKFLDLMLASIDLKRDNIYITNIVNDRPPENRDPTIEEIERYSKFADMQLKIIKPKVVVTLGRFSMNYFLKKYAPGVDVLPISKMHGRVFQANANNLNFKIVTLYHPASALYNGGMRQQNIDDFAILKQFR